MSTNNPQQGPAWGQQPQQPGYGQPQPGYGQPPMQPGFAPQPPKKKGKAGKIIGFGCLGIVGLFVVIAIIAAVASSGGSDSTSTKPATSSAPQQSTKEKAPADVPVKISATSTKFTPSILASGSDYTSVKVTITNNSDKDVSVNPLYFSLTDTSGGKHTTDNTLGEDKHQIATVKLAPGENVTGVVTAEGKFTAKKVTFNEDLFGTSYTGTVK